jgi:hypothetical protein
MRSGPLSRTISLAAAAICALLTCSTLRADENDALTLDATPRAAATEPAPQSPIANLSLLPDDRSVYAPPAPPREDEGLNTGGVTIDLSVRYLTDYVYRGVDLSEVGGGEDSPNLQFDGRLSFNLGKFPSPFLGVFVNVFDEDPISRFQEIRPFFGLTWDMRPFLLEAGNLTYIYPERDRLNTGEIYGKITFDDSWLFQTDRPLLSPYVLGAYDYDKYDGWYFEGGLRHEWVFEGTGLTLAGVGSIGYVLDHPFFAAEVGGDDTGVQHWQVGLEGTYSLNHLFRISTRYGTWNFEGYLYYTDTTDDALRADQQVWGGAGIRFRY